jgi:hypothetical protein
LPPYGGPITSQTPGSTPATDYIRTSSSCVTGAIVTVSPVQGAQLLHVAYAQDNRITALVLDVMQPVTVSVWQQGRLTGQELLKPVSSPN